MNKPLPDDDTITRDQWKFLGEMIWGDEGYSSDNQDHDILFELEYIKAVPSDHVDWYGCYVRLTYRGLNAWLRNLERTIAKVMESNNE
jgi:hypothetical protein